MAGWMCGGVEEMLNLVTAFRKDNQQLDSGYINNKIFLIIREVTMLF